MHLRQRERVLDFDTWNPRGRPLPEEVHALFDDIYGWRLVNYCIKIHSEDDARFCKCERAGAAAGHVIVKIQEEREMSLAQWEKSGVNSDLLSALSVYI